jgi:predicted RNA binding protein YcfA (HicA-like mRNA interferase family)
MAKLRVLSGRQVCRILQRFGFHQVRRRGSHIVMQRRVDETTITVPVPDHPELKTGTLRSILRQSNLPRTEFEQSQRKRHQ